MPALVTGKRAPAINLPTVDGGHFSLTEARSRGPVVLVFFKISCPVCQFAMPYFERLHQALNGKNVSIIGISQNPKRDTEFFNKQYGVTFPVALDDPRHYEASNDYGLTSVPTFFYINEEAEIEVAAVGWSKKDFEEIARKISEAIAIGPIVAFKPGEEVPAFRAG